MINVRKIFILMIFTAAFPVFAAELNFPADNSKYTKEAALSLLELCSGHLKNKTAELFAEYSFKVIKQKHYEKKADQIDHTSAYTIGKGSVYIEGKKKSACLIVIRGTDGNEWYSNFNFVPSVSEMSHFSQSFLFSAEEILLEIEKLFPDKNTLIVISGHSRGAAVANLLALLLNEVYNPANIYAYTFATPATVRNVPELTDYNIFNFINPCDLVPRLPAQAWGYRRAGKDIYLDSESDFVNSKNLDAAINNLSKICPTLSSYYRDRHSLVHGGLSSDGITMYEIMMALGVKLSQLSAVNLSSEIGSEFDLNNIKFNSDGKNIMIPQIENDSDFAPMLSYISFLVNNNGEGFNKLLEEHLPQTYMTKLNRMK
jgi:hypothetical protein